MLTVWFHSALVAQSQVPSTSQNFRASSAHVAKDECQRASTGHQEANAKCFICRRLAELPCHECAATLRGEISEIDQNPERAAAAPHSFVLRALHRPVKAIADQLPDLDGGLCRLTELASVFVSPEDVPVVCVENRNVSTKTSPQIIRGAFCTLGYKYSKAFGAETSGKVVRASQPLFGNLGK
ncbi:hypothetical protein NDA11_005767 [Ustilago hordei]|uniref:Uncharacterized protein n=1 Tax=Ustilago hordei TaxID=120017 RepID=I2G214_USTHO|nr:hypothetical protein NDA10_004131 [Ustilago hordei]KAJ1585138.1 hypothetical protein NDA15_003321 [Ustilago hordei]KAJ1588310.1 hypothetical protein NDA12_006093 [Ustilago hordei]KAJ1593189.1 hypothetical protein NDA11_005767 [Ustilago hordei]KAJ1601400.1 hypothetical protein NDA14_002145 [Ustilago hordei]